MYSREEKIQIMEAFLESGLTMSQAERKPGWPSRLSLSRWMEEIRRGELAVNPAKPKGHCRKRKRHTFYSDKTKAEAIRLYEMGRRPSAIARILGIDCSKNVRVWAKKAREEGHLPRDDFKPKPFDLGRSEGDMTRKKRKIPPEVAELTPAELENACLRAVLADLKVGGWDLDSISNKKKSELGERLRTETGLALRKITDFLRISKSSYEYHRKRLGVPDKYAYLRKRIRDLFWENNARYGYRRIRALLCRDGICVSEKVVRRIMREGGLAVRYPRTKREWSSYSGETSDAPANIVARNFTSGLPNLLWLTDITEFKLPGFKCYLSPVIDCFDGKVVAWRASLRPDAALVNGMLDDATITLSPGEHPIIHSDRGGHYRWPGWIARCEAAGLTRSMSKKGCSPDNSACEGFFGRLKNEFFYHRSWSGVTFDQFKAELAEYLRWYNQERIKESLSWMSPDDYRKSLGLVA